MPRPRILRAGMAHRGEGFLVLASRDIDLDRLLRAIGEPAAMGRRLSREGPLFVVESDTLGFIVTDLDMPERRAGRILLPPPWSRFARTP